LGIQFHKKLRLPGVLYKGKQDLSEQILYQAGAWEREIPHSPFTKGGLRGIGRIL